MNNKVVYVAHIKKRSDTDKWDEPHYLEEHLLETARLAAQCAKMYLGREWGYIAGKLHDLGKFRKRFQDYIRHQSGFERENAHIENAKRAPHSTAGAIYAVKTASGIGHILAYIIAGHHAGLPDWEGGKGGLKYRLSEAIEEYNEAIQEEILPEILKLDNLDIPEFARFPETMALWIRMLFSCLVDADFLDTESYMQPNKAETRKNEYSLPVLADTFFEKIQALQQQAKESPLSQIRNSILNECLAAAEQSPGLFSLTVPTGGGKTLSSLAFALKHALKFGKNRIIYSIPFTSIIEQNADVFREFLGVDAVLEHHSNLDVEPAKETAKARLASENWDAPLIVTTNVQLFESLFAAKTSRCRKLHNLINSIIILDEA